MKVLCWVICFLCAVAAFAAGGSSSERHIALLNANMNFRAMAAEALEKGQVEQLAQIERDAAAFADSVGFEMPLFQDNEVILVRFLEKNYVFIANVDSISKYDYSPGTYDRFGEELKTFFRKRMASGELEGMLAQVPNASDRAYARIVIARCVNVPRQELSGMIEKYSGDLTNGKQLDYLVHRYWYKEGYDLENYVCTAWGVPYNMMLGGVSRSIDDGLGIAAEVDKVYKNILLELRLVIDLNEYKGEEPVTYSGGGFGADVGATVFHTDRLFLRIFTGIGVGINELRWDDDEFVDKFYPAFGVGAIADFFFNTAGTTRFGARVRSGVRNVGDGPRDISSGAQFYVSLSLVLLETKYRRFEFEYPETRQ